MYGCGLWGPWAEKARNLKAPEQFIVWQRKNVGRCATPGDALGSKPNGPAFVDAQLPGDPALRYVLFPGLENEFPVRVGGIQARQHFQPITGAKGQRGFARER